MKILYVTRVYEVRIPDDRNSIYEDIDLAQGNPEDAAIVKASDEAIAMHMSYAHDTGKFDNEVSYYDSYVRDVPPDTAEYEVG
jgi:hypothetical protein